MVNFPRLALRAIYGRRLPITGGTLAVPGLSSEVRIERDSHSVPYITAANDRDAWFGLGFAMAQDRAFQLEAMLRVIRGTLSELAGPDALPIDRLSRRIGFLRSAQAQLSVLDERTHDTLSGFAAGVTAGASAGMPKSAHEFAILRTRPTPWTEVDALGVLKLQSFALAGNWDVELARLKILQDDGPGALEALDPTYPAWQGVITSPGRNSAPAADRLAGEMAQFAAVVGNGASNNWVVAGSRSATGRPLLANDPHLAPVLPPHWYLCRITTPEWSLAGAALVGGAAVPAGHNGFAAWGVTAGLIDNTDLYLEQVGPDGKSVRQGRDFVACEVIHEAIAVKGQAPVIEEILITPRGPIIGPALDGEVGAISMQATWLRPLPTDGLLGVQRARSFDAFRACFERWPAVSLNVAYADETGTIGYQLVGDAPVRRKGFGLLPTAGWDPESGWEDEAVPFHEMPASQDPPTGWIASANNQPSLATKPFLGVDWIDGYRYGRIAELLDARTDWTLADFQSMQREVESVPWREMRETILATPVAEPAAQRAIDILRAWDGRLGEAEAGATVFSVLVAELCRRIGMNRAPRSHEWALGRGFHPLAPHTVLMTRRIGHLVKILREQPANWFERSWDEEIAAALAAAVTRLEEVHGSNQARWGWGHVRQLTLRHPLGSRRPLNRVFNLGPFPCGGDGNTVAQAGVNPLDETGNPTHIQSLRMVVDVGDWDKSRWVLPGGQSGNPFSPHYSDQLAPWRSGGGIPIAWSAEAVASAAVSRLDLSPSPS